jgi:hypothetical protein
VLDGCLLIECESLMRSDRSTKAIGVPSLAREPIETRTFREGPRRLQAVEPT